MDLQFLDLISRSGAFGDIWRARDKKLERDLAIKIIREASVGISNALQHARALARVKHPNVVVVHTIEKVRDPEGAKEVDAIVMELLHGQTIGERLRGRPFTSDELLAVSQGILDAMEHIHAQGMVHGDLHEHNVMICAGQAKVIDLLHRFSLAMVSEERRQEQVVRELRALKILMQQLVGHSELSALQAHAFTEAVRGDASIIQLKLAMKEAVAGEPPVRLRLEHPKTPLNLLDLVVPDLHRERVRGLLGPPDFVQADAWVYRYQETQVEVKFTESDSVKAVVIALCFDKKYYGSHPTAHTDQPLGELTLADVLDDFNGIEDVEYFESLRTKEVFLRGRWGPPGAWSYYACGSLLVLTGVGALAPVDFEWDLESGRLLTDPRNVRINWMAATSFSGDDVPGFNWFIKG
jgi:tRNA A-37 threonylcarbamoyl transferase component Bud32